MIIQLVKYLFIGSYRDLDEFFQRAQEAGCLEFLSPSGRKSVEYTPPMQELLAAIKILRKLPAQEQYEGKIRLERAQGIAENVLQLAQQVHALTVEKRELELEIARVAPFGDFDIEDIRYIEEVGDKRVQFFCRKASREEGAELSDGIFWVSTDYDLDYFISIQKEAVTDSSIIEMQVPRSVEDARIQLAKVQKELQHKEHGIKAQVRYLDYLVDAFFEHWNDYALSHARGEAELPMVGHLIAAEAWVPAHKVAQLLEITGRLAVHCEEVAIQEGERIPTYVENHGVGKIGEDLVKIYDTPAATDRDPSRYVFWSFVLFFSMIVADGGYGFLYLALAAYLRYKCPGWAGYKKRFIQLLAVLATGCILWGLLTSSFFGLAIRPQSALGELSVVQRLATVRAAYHIEQKDPTYDFWVHQFPQLRGVTDPKAFLTVLPEPPTHAVTKYEVLEDFSDAILMEFALMIGILHVGLSLLRYVRRNWAGLGWAIFLVGGYLYFPSVVQATSMVHYLSWIRPELATQIGLQLLWGGIGLAFFLALVQRGWAGLGEVANSIQIFSDVLSYLRLYALALAGTILAETFNDMGAGVGLVLGAVVIVVGHGMNIVMGAMGGVIHGLRLNFIEWYHHSFEGGGVWFRPLRKLSAKDVD